MPGQVFIHKAQVARMAELDTDIIVLELPESSDALEVWLHDGRPYESIVMGSDGNPLGSMKLDPEGNVLEPTGEGDAD